jgi:molybdopterin-binding protein
MCRAGSDVCAEELAKDAASDALDQMSIESSFISTSTRTGDIIQPMKLSARNHLVGEVEEVKLGNVMAHVVVRVGENMIESVITRRSAEEMGLKVGDTVAAIIKSTEVMLQKD